MHEGVSVMFYGPVKVDSVHRGVSSALFIVLVIVDFLWMVVFLWLSSLGMNKFEQGASLFNCSWVVCGFKSGWGVSITCSVTLTYLRFSFHVSGGCPYVVWNCPCLLEAVGCILGEGPLPLGWASPASDSHIHVVLSLISCR